LAETISSIASVLWPVLVLVALLLFRQALLRVVLSAEKREWSLEVGGQKISMKQLSDQQNTLIADLQAQIGALRQQVTDLTPETAADTQPREADGRWVGRPVPRRILWVDDSPVNNALMVEQLTRDGVRVDLARSTREGLAELTRHSYGAVVSDMGRFENDGFVSDAGLRLLDAVRDRDSTMPFVIYTSFKSVAKYRDEVLSHEQAVITASPVALTEKLRALGVLPAGD